MSHEAADEISEGTINNLVFEQYFIPCCPEIGDCLKGRKDLLTQVSGVMRDGLPDVDVLSKKTHVLPKVLKII